MNIVVFSSDPGNHRFIEPIVDRWRTDGHEARIINNYSPIAEADVYWFDFCDNNLVSASVDHSGDLRQKRVIARLHAVEYYLNFYKNVNWSVVDDLIFVSEHMRDKVGKLPVRTHVVHNGIDLDKLTFKNRQPGHRIAYAGNIVPTKGILLMLHYFRQLLNHDDRFILYLVGLNRFHGREGEYYHHYLEASGIKDSVVEGEEVGNINDWLEDKHYLWQPSLAESFSLIVGEAMAKGIKPLINNFSGAQSLWPQNCIYTDFDGFKKILFDKYNSQEYRDFAKRYDFNKIMEQINEILSNQKPERL